MGSVGQRAASRHLAGFAVYLLRPRHGCGVVLGVQVRVVDDRRAVAHGAAPAVRRLLAVGVPRALEVVLLVDVVGDAHAGVGEGARRAEDGLLLLVLTDRAVHKATCLLEVGEQRREVLLRPLLALLVGVVLAARQHLAVVPRGEGVPHLARLVPDKSDVPQVRQGRRQEAGGTRHEARGRRR